MLVLIMVGESSPRSSPESRVQLLHVPALAFLDDESKTEERRILPALSIDTAAKGFLPPPFCSNVRPAHSPYNYSE